MKTVLVMLAAASFLGQATIASGQELPKTKTDVQTVVEGNNEFALDLYARLSKEKGNIIFSPYSISTALAMTYGGARGETAEQMAKVLRFTLPQEKLHPAFGLLVAEMQKDEDNRPFQLHVANSLWGQKGHPFKADFLRLTEKNYRAGLKEVDFQNNPNESRKTINRWVENQTKNLIKELLLEPDVTTQTKLVLTNAIYFKANWEIRFRNEETKDAVFEMSPKERVKVPMMHRRGLFNYAADDDFQWLELPYHGGRQSMVFILPKKKGHLDALEKTLTAGVLKNGMAKIRPCPGTAEMPRFKATCRFSLASKLAEMGMPLVFGPGGDFSAIGDGLTLSQVIHEAKINVNELGTEASAATAVAMNLSGLEATPFTFRADHPFVFLIRDLQTGVILFQGRLTDPRGGTE